MERIGVFGGSFDPIHTGHLLLADQAADAGNLSRVVFMPAWVSPFKVGGGTSCAPDRYNMVKAAVAEDPRFEVSDLEIKREGVSYTIHTLRELGSLWGPEKRICLIMGADAFLSIEKWVESEALLRDYDYIIASRPGSDLVRLKEHCLRMHDLYGTDITQLAMPQLDISSTEIRQRVRDGKSIRYQVTEPVRAYIYENNLYQS